MRVEDCYQLGYVTKPHGLKGEVMIYLDVDYPEDYEEMESLLLLQKHQLVPFFIEHLSLQPGSKAIVKFEDVDTREAASKISGLEIYLPDTELPELDEDQFYYHEIVGYKMNQHDEVVGIIKAVISTGPQELFEVQSEGFEFLVPIVDEIVIAIDHENKIVTVELPDGLIEIYRNQDTDED